MAVVSNFGCADPRIEKRDMTDTRNIFVVQVLFVIPVLYVLSIGVSYIVSTGEL